MRRGIAHIVSATRLQTYLAQVRLFVLRLRYGNKEQGTKNEGYYV